MASDKYATIAVTKEVRSAINSHTAWAGGLTEEKLSNSEALAASMTLARQHPDLMAKILTERHVATS
jgi:hypothetical protein